MIDILPPELQRLIFSFLRANDLVVLSRISRQLSRDVPSMFICLNCRKTGNVALCGPMVESCACHSFFCEKCFPAHYDYGYHMINHLDEYMPYTIEISTEVSNHVFTFHVECLYSESD
jgi:hypothetical protein